MSLLELKPMKYEPKHLIKMINIGKPVLRYISDDKRHLICIPYSIENLHKMAEDLGIKRCWFHKDHYDIPKRRIDEIREKTEWFSSKQIVKVIKEYNEK